MALLVLGAAALVAASGLGSATAGVSLCPGKTLCVFIDNDFSSEVVKITKDGVSNKLAKKMNNEASSVINNRGKRAYLYDGKNGKGERVCISPHAEVSDLGGFADFNDAASSSKNTDKKSDCPKA